MKLSVLLLRSAGKKRITGGYRYYGISWNDDLRRQARRGHGDRGGRTGHNGRVRRVQEYGDQGAQDLRRKSDFGVCGVCYGRVLPFGTL